MRSARLASIFMSICHVLSKRPSPPRKSGRAGLVNGRAGAIQPADPAGTAKRRRAGKAARTVDGVCAPQAGAPAARTGRARVCGHRSPPRAPVVNRLIRRYSHRRQRAAASRGEESRPMRPVPFTSARGSVRRGTGRIGPIPAGPRPRAGAAGTATRSARGRRTPEVCAVDLRERDMATVPTTTRRVPGGVRSHPTRRRHPTYSEQFAFVLPQCSADEAGIGTRPLGAPPPSARARGRARSSPEPPPAGNRNGAGDPAIEPPPSPRTRPAARRGRFVQIGADVNLPATLARAPTDASPT